MRRKRGRRPGLVIQAVVSQLGEIGNTERKGKNP